MNKKIKIVLYVVLCLDLLSAVVYGRYETSDEETKSMVRRVVNYPVVNYVAKNATFNKDPGKEIIIQKMPVNPRKTEKKEHDYNNVVEFLDFELVTDEVDGQTLFDLGGESFLGFARSYPEDTTFFKADFSTFFNAKKGDEVSISIGENQYLGIIDFVNNQDSSEMIVPEGEEFKTFHFIIKPYDELVNENYIHSISIGGVVNKNSGNFIYEGDINYEGTENLRFKINEKVGVLVPAVKFGDYISIDLGFGSD